MTRLSHFESIAADYARARPTYPAELADWLASMSPARAVAWEAGCGSGQLTSLLAERFERVIATDRSEAQMRQASGHANVRFVAASAERAPVRMACCDLVVAAQAAHWFELGWFFDEARRVARGGALVALVGYGNATLGDDVLDARFARFHDEEIGRFWPAARSILLDAYRSIDFPFEEVRAPTFALRRRWNVRELLAYVETWSAVQRAGAAGQGARFSTFARDMMALWGAGRRDLTWPVAIRAGRR